MRGSVEDQLGQCSKDQGEHLERWSECSDGEETEAGMQAVRKQ